MEDSAAVPHDQGSARAETFQPLLDKALEVAGITDKVRPFHDLRHTAITNDAAAGASAIAVMAKARHSNMRTTQTYLHLVGVVFRSEVERLEQRLVGDVEVPAETRPSNLLPIRLPD